MGLLRAWDLGDERASRDVFASGNESMVCAQVSPLHGGVPLPGPMTGMSGVGDHLAQRRARFEAQVLPHLDAAYRFARWLSGDSGDADDLVQEAILRAFRGFDGLRGGDVKAWLLTIVRNCHATAVQQRRRRVLVPLPAENERTEPALVAPAPGPEGATIERDEGRALRAVMAALPEEQRETLLLREIEELSYREIATITGVPIGTVMSRLARARASLRKLWQDASEGESRGVR